MTGQSLTQRHRNGGVVPDMDDESRLDRVERRIDRIEHDVADIKTGVEQLLAPSFVARYGLLVSIGISTFLVVGTVIMLK